MADYRVREVESNVAQAPSLGSVERLFHVWLGGMGAAKKKNQSAEADWFFNST